MALRTSRCAGRRGGCRLGGLPGKRLLPHLAILPKILVDHSGNVPEAGRRVDGPFLVAAARRFTPSCNHFVKAIAANDCAVSVFGSAVA